MIVPDQQPKHTTPGWSHLSVPEHWNIIEWRTGPIEICVSGCEQDFAAARQFLFCLFPRAFYCQVSGRRRCLFGWIDPEIPVVFGIVANCHYEFVSSRRRQL